jgi:hypothetical protein
MTAVLYPSKIGEEIDDFLTLRGVLIERTRIEVQAIEKEEKRFIDFRR